MIEEFNRNNLKKIYSPKSSSHKGDNGKLLIIGGSVLFHAASLWSLKIASRIVDMVFYSSVDSNNEIVQKEKDEFRNGIVVPRGKLDKYIEEADVILIGPGLPREEGIEKGDDDTRELTERLFRKYPTKKWVVDGGSLQVINSEILPQTSIITPHHKEFRTLFGIEGMPDSVVEMAGKYKITILLKGEVDVISNGKESVRVYGGNAGMTKGGTGDVLAGLVAALYCKNEAFLSACVASYINKKAGESLAKKVGIYFNASDLADEIPKVMKQLVRESLVKF
jgi:ADP-dependent NAD(P)H-hydrate dehydratase / NAD(P)H-hydrate epimerase